MTFVQFNILKTGIYIWCTWSSSDHIKSLNKISRSAFQTIFVYFYLVRIMSKLQYETFLPFWTNFDHRASEKQIQCNVRKKQCSKSTFVLSISSLKSNCINDTSTVAKLLIFFSSILILCSFLLPINVKVDTWQKYMSK